MLANQTTQRLGVTRDAITMHRASRFPIALCLYGFIAVWFPPPAAIAHDSWLVPEYDVLEKSAVHVVFSTGEVFPISEHATSPDRVAEWFVQRNKERQPVVGISIRNKELGGEIVISGTGTSIVALALKPKYIELPAAKFEDYLHDEHAEAVIKLRRSRSETEKPGREFYTKFAKTFVELAYSAPEPFSVTPIGHTLEIIPLMDPCHLRVGDELKVRVVIDGIPGEGLRVSAGHGELPAHTYSVAVQTGADGEAKIPLKKSGIWFLRTHLIRRIADSDARAGKTGVTLPDGETADWESFWASITFYVGPRPTP